MSARSNLESGRTGRSGAAGRRWEAGDQRGGFEIVVDRVGRLVHMKLWGVWHLPVAEEFHSAVDDIARPFAGKSWAIIADSRLFGAQSPDVSRLRQEAMSKARDAGCGKIAAIADKVVYAMQFKRIAEESHVGSAVFQDEESALAWIREDQRSK
jgi:hypothetical protein